MQLYDQHCNKIILDIYAIITSQPRSQFPQQEMLHQASHLNARY